MNVILIEMKKLKYSPLFPRSILQLSFTIHKCCSNLDVRMMKKYYKKKPIAVEDNKSDITTIIIL